MNTTTTKNQKGFTLIETIIAIFILTVTVSSLLQLTAQGFYTVRYLRNQIVANNLMQEGLEFMRNSRDTFVGVNGGTFQDWVAAQAARGCMPDGSGSAAGCIVDPYTSTGAVVEPCTGSCQVFQFYEDTGFYGYGYKGHTYPQGLTGTTAPYYTDYIRTVRLYTSTDPLVADQVIVTSTVSWVNGSVRKTVSQSMLLTKW